MRHFVALLLVASSVWAQEGQHPPGLRRRVGGGGRMASVREVQFDAVVSDAKGRPVTGLGAADLRVAEDGVAQQVVSVVEHEAAEAGGRRVVQPAHTYTNRPEAFGHAATTVILIDKVNSSGPGLADLEGKLRGYLRHVPRGTEMAIFSLDTGLRTLMQMTDDAAVFEAVRAAMGDPMPATFLLGQPNGGGATDGMRQELLHLGIAELAEYWRSYPGRKNLLWLTGDVPVELADGQLDDPLADTVERKEEGGRLMETMVLNRVAVYPLQVRAAPLGNAVPVGMNGRGQGPTARVGDVSYLHNPAERWSAMEEIAARTGGRAFRWESIEKDGIAAAAAAGSHFYTITYRSTLPAKDGWHRVLKVETAQAGRVVEAPRGYVVRMARTEEKIPASTVHARMMIQAALQEQAIPQQELVFRARVGTEGAVLRDPKGQAAAQGNALSERVREKGYRMLRIDYVAEAAKLHFARGADGRYEHTLLLYAMLYDDEGRLVNSVRGKLVESLEAADYTKTMREGVSVAQMVAIPVTGRYVLRLGVFDPEGPVMGTVEVQGVEGKE